MSVIISIIAMVVCIISVAIKYPRVGTFDYLGFIIGILAIMLTFVVAWQIWITIDSKNEVKSIHKEFNSRCDFLTNEIRKLEKREKDYMIEIDREHSFISGVHMFHKVRLTEDRVHDTPTIIGTLYVQYVTAPVITLQPTQKEKSKQTTRCVISKIT